MFDFEVPSWRNYHLRRKDCPPENLIFDFHEVNVIILHSKAREVKLSVDLDIARLVTPEYTKSIKMVLLK